ncbi:hypothetical protein [Nocardioides immobilis]|nr:hypothetical protein [Nocardioides immobilis]
MRSPTTVVASTSPLDAGLVVDVEDVVRGVDGGGHVSARTT